MKTKSSPVSAHLFAAFAKPGDKFRALWTQDPENVHTVVSTDCEPIRNARIIRVAGAEWYFRSGSTCEVLPVS